jgi:serine protease Do
LRIMSTVPFCERNIKAWLALLGAVVIGVLAMSGWIAYRGKGLQTFSHALAGGPEPSPAVLVPTVVGQAGPASPVAFVRPDTTVHGPGYGAAPIGGPVYAPPNAPPMAPPPNASPDPNTPPLADTVARATAGGGIRFVGRATMPNADHGNAFNRAATAIRPTVVAIAAIRYAPVAPKPNQNPNAVQFLDPYDGIPDRFIGQKSFEAVGSGVVVDPSGLIVTNDHVIHGAGVVYASLPSAPEVHLPAQVVAADPNIDLALLKITNGPMQAATLGDSSQVDIGDWVLAVGYPFGLQLTVTSGIVGGSRVALSIGGQSYTGLIQTDAPINKGSSGGPLVNLRGEVIGINTAIYAPTGVFSGTGFAIPSNRVGAFVARHTQRSASLAAATKAPSSMTATWLGLGLVDVSPDLATQLRFPFAGGAFVASVVLDSPAEDAEVNRGDIVTSLADQPVTDVESIIRILQTLSPGQVVPITVWRGNKTVTTMMRLRGA